MIASLSCADQSFLRAMHFAASDHLVLLPYRQVLGLSRDPMAIVAYGCVRCDKPTFQSITTNPRRVRGNDATTSPSGNLHQTHLIWFDIVGVIHEGFHILRGLNNMSETIITSESATAPRTVTLHNGQVLSFNSNISTNIEEIPIIDARKIWCERLEDRRSVAEEIREAARTIGFFYLVNHVRAIPVRGLHEHKQCLIVRRE